MHKETLNKKKCWLYRYRNNQAKILRLQDKLETLEERIISIKSPNYSGMPRGSSPVTLDDLLSDKEQLLHRIKSLTTKGVTLKREILDAIDTLEHQKQADILEYWFINGYTAEQIDEILNCSTTYVYRLYSRSIKSIIIPGISNDD